MKHSLILVLILLIGGLAVYFWYFDRQTNQELGNVNLPEQSTSTDTAIDSFDDCVDAGNPVMESYPRQCRADGQTFTEDIGDVVDKVDLVQLDELRPNDVVESPLTITGQARGPWYFEATFPVILTDWDGLIIAESYAQAQGDWMTEDFVPFEATLEFEVPDYGDSGSLILQKANPSGLPENDDAYEIPVRFD